MLNLVRFVFAAIGMFLFGCNSSPGSREIHDTRNLYPIQQFAVILVDGFSSDVRKGEVRARLIDPIIYSHLKITTSDLLTLRYYLTERGSSRNKRFMLHYELISIELDDGGSLPVGRNNSRPVQSSVVEIEPALLPHLSKPGVEIDLRVNYRLRQQSAIVFSESEELPDIERVKLEPWMLELVGQGELKISWAAIKSYQSSTRDERKSGIFYISFDGVYGGFCTGSRCTYKHMKILLNACEISTKTSCHIFAVGGQILWGTEIPELS